MESSPSDDELVEKVEEALREPSPLLVGVVDSFQTVTSDIKDVYTIVEAVEPIRRTLSMNFRPFIRDKKPEGEST